MMPRPGRQLAIPHRTQLASERLPGHADAEVLPQPLAQIDDPPAHHAVHGRDRAVLDHRPERRAMRVVQQRGLTGRLAVDQPVRPVLVELEHPVANDLQGHAADPGCLGAGGSLIDCRQSQEPPGLARILACTGRGTQPPRVEVGAKRDRHDRTPRSVTRESEPARVGQCHMSHAQGALVSASIEAITKMERTYVMWLHCLFADAR